MNNILSYIFLLFFTFSFSQDLKHKNAADDVLVLIEKIENGKEYYIKLPNQIACLTNIYPKKVDGTYFGILYYPTLEEIKLWKDWVNKNRSKLSFGIIADSELEYDEIIVEYEKGKTRSLYCK